MSLIIVSLVILLISLLYWKKRKNDKIVALIEQFPGPKAYPLIGSAWALLGTPVNSKKFYLFLAKTYPQANKVPTPMKLDRLIK